MSFSESYPNRVSSRRFRRWIPSLSFFFLIFAAALQSFNTFRLRGSITLADVFLFAAIVALLPGYIQSRTRLWAPWWFIASGVLFFSGYLLRGLYGLGLSPPNDFVHSMILTYCLYIVPVAVASQPRIEERHLALLAVAWLAGHLVNAFCAIGQSRGVDFGPLNEYMRAGGWRYGGFTMHPNNLGMFLAFAMPMAVGLIFQARNLMGYWIVLFLTGSLLYAIDLTGSRTAIAASIIGSATAIFLYVVTIQSRTWAMQFLRLLIFLMIVGFSWGFLVADETETSAISRLFLGTGEASKSNAERAAFAIGAWQVFEENPVVGAGFRDVVSAHNSWLMVLGSSGVLGVLAVAIRDFGMALTLLTGMSLAPRGSSVFWVLASCLGAFVVWELEALKETMLHYRDGFVIQGIGVLAAMLMVRLRNTGNPRIHQSGLVDGFHARCLGRR